jgi:hypothetical protein
MMRKACILVHVTYSKAEAGDTQQEPGESSEEEPGEVVKLAQQTVLEELHHTRVALLHVVGVAHATGLLQRPGGALALLTGQEGSHVGRRPGVRGGRRKEGGERWHINYNS